MCYYAEGVFSKLLTRKAALYFLIKRTFNTDLSYNTFIGDLSYKTHAVLTITKCSNPKINNFSRTLVILFTLENMNIGSSLKF